MKATPLLIKFILFFLPVKTFYCAKCMGSRYKIMTNAELSKYHVVVLLALNFIIAL
jgi:hypothetical protein